MRPLGLWTEVSSMIWTTTILHRNQLRLFLFYILPQPNTPQLLHLLRKTHLWKPIIDKYSFSETGLTRDCCGSWNQWISAEDFQETAGLPGSSLISRLCFAAADHHHQWQVITNCGSKALHSLVRPSRWCKPIFGDSAAQTHLTVDLKITLWHK